MRLIAFTTLAKREYWEHRAFIRVPLILAVVIVFVLIIGMLTAHNTVWSYTVNGIHIEHSPFYNLFHQDNTEDFKKSLWVFLCSCVMLPMIIALSVMIFFYALSCLYDERRDRTILFWKSMPVSDTLTVLSKIVSTFITAPVITAGMIVLTQFLTLILLSFWALKNTSGLLSVIWSPSLLLMLVVYAIGIAIMSVLWLAPVLGWLLFISSIVKRKPFLVAFFIPLGWMLVELMLFHTHYLADLVIERWHGLWKLIADVVQRKGLFDILGHPVFWWGLAVCCLFIAASIYIRRFKDDSYI